VAASVYLILKGEKMAKKCKCDPEEGKHYHCPLCAVKLDEAGICEKCADGRILSMGQHLGAAMSVLRQELALVPKRDKIQREHIAKEIALIDKTWEKIESGDVG
jgi:hypothetical protein